MFSLAVLFTFSLQAQQKTPANTTAPATLESVEAPRREKPTPEQQEARYLERQAAIATELGLTDEQTVQFHAINDKYRAQMRDLRANNTQEREAMGQEMKVIRQAKQTELATVLTPEQMEKLKTTAQTMRNNRRSKVKQRPEGVAPRRKVGGGK